MMLLHLHAVDDVQGLALVADDVAGVVHYLRPSLFLTLLVTLVVLSSIRAAVLFMRAPKSNKVVLVRQVKQESEKHALAEKSPSTSTAPQTSSATTPAPGLQAADRQRAPMVSWLWGLVKWDRLPPLPVDRAEATMSQTERGWQPPLSSPPPRRQTQFDQTGPSCSSLVLSHTAHPHSHTQSCTSRTCPFPWRN